MAAGGLQKSRLVIYVKYAFWRCSYQTCTETHTSAPNKLHGIPLASSWSPVLKCRCLCRALHLATANDSEETARERVLIARLLLSREKDNGIPKFYIHGLHFPVEMQMFSSFLLQTYSG